MGNFRPRWCPHDTCHYLRSADNQMCIGRLPKPEPHNGAFNTHRMCLNGVLPKDEVFDLQVNRADVGWFEWLFEKVKADTPKKDSTYAKKEQK